MSHYDKRDHDILAKAGSTAIPDAGRPVPKASQKAYSSPILLKWGTLTEITRGGFGVEEDFGLAGSKGI